jgi:hypothetical protein
LNLPHNCNFCAYSCIFLADLDSKVLCLHTVSDLDNCMQVRNKVDCCDNYKPENTQDYLLKMENLEKEGIDTAIAFPFGKSNKAFKAQAAERVIDDQETV